MKQLMCTSCGEFVLAVPKNGELVPAGGDDCPACGGDEFERVRS